MKTRQLLPLLVMLTFALSHAAPPAAILKSEFIHDTGPYPQIHATTIVETPAGLVSAWFGGTHERNPDVCIWVSRLVDGQWIASVETANGVQPDGTRHPTWNPVLFQPKDAPLMLFYKVGPTPETWWGELKTSPDGGKTWSAARRLPDGILGPIKNKPVQLANGDILCPTSNETHEKPSKWSVHFERSSDGGRPGRRSARCMTASPSRPFSRASFSSVATGSSRSVGRGRIAFSKCAATMAAGPGGR